MGRRQLRPSQYVTTYGSGALIALPDGHVVIPTIKKIVTDLKRHNAFNVADDLGRFGLDKFRIMDEKMEKILGRYTNEQMSIKIFALPTNADLGKPDKEPLFKADIFPKWSVCYQHSDTPILSKLIQKGERPSIRCPFCEADGKDPRRGTSVRFIQACKAGHMDDIDWKKAVHMGTKCSGDVFLWHETGNSMNFSISCYGYYDRSGFHQTKCGSTVDYFTLKSRSQNNALLCSGVFQEGGKKRCEENSRIILKNASNLRISEIISSVYIPNIPGYLYESLSPYAQVLDRFYDKQFTKEELVEFLRTRRNRYKIPLDVIRDVDEASIEEIKELLDNMCLVMERQTETIDVNEAIDKELESLLKASVEGYPPQQNSMPTKFHVENTDNIVIDSEEFGLRFKITPIRLLYVTKVQAGYYREVESTEEDEDLQVTIRHTGNLVRNYYDEDGSLGSKTRWFIGNQPRGEGLFIQTCDTNSEKHHDPLDGKITPEIDSWKKLFDKYSENEKEERRRTNPRFVWWHSLSHKIINRLAIDSGFSASSMGERVYCRWNNSKNIFESGILLYTAQTGGDGTLGGLTSLARQFENILKNISDEIKSCSNDPICYERKHTKRRANGAACHACMLISETSCELYNKFLDRRLVMEIMKHGSV